MATVGGEAFIPILRDRLPAVSFVTVGELFFGATKARWGEKRILKLETILKRYTVIPGTYDIARAYGDIKAAFRDQVDECDMWIAATAIHMNYPSSPTICDILSQSAFVSVSAFCTPSALSLDPPLGVCVWGCKCGEVPR